MDSEEFIWEAPARVVVMIEDQDGTRQFLAFPNLIGPVNLSQETEHYRDWTGPILRSVQRGPVMISIPQHGTWYRYDPGQGDPVPDFTTPRQALPTPDKEIEP